MKRVFFLGAGFSRPAGAPLLGEINEAILSTDLEGSYETLEILPTSKFEFKNTKDILEELKTIIGRNTLMNFEEVLLFFDDIAQSGDAAYPRPSEISVLRDALIWSFAFVLKKRLEEKERTRTTEIYESFLQTLDPTRDSIVTVNVDLILEHRLEALLERGDIDYGLDYGFKAYTNELEHLNRTSNLEILKLHGSLNWVWCSNEACVANAKLKVKHEKWIEPWPIGHWGCTVCDKKGILGFAIVPPRPDKNLGLPYFYPIWSRAYEILSNADEIIFIGYSLPDYDKRVRELLHIAISRSKVTPSIVVVSPDTSSMNRYLQLPCPDCFFKRALFEELPTSYFQDFHLP